MSLPDVKQWGTKSDEYVVVESVEMGWVCCLRAVLLGRVKYSKWNYQYYVCVRKVV